MRTSNEITSRLEAIQSKIARNEAQILEALNRSDMEEVVGIVPQNAELNRQIALLQWVLKD